MIDVINKIKYNCLANLSKEIKIERRVLLQIDQLQIKLRLLIPFYPILEASLQEQCEEFV